MIMINNPFGQDPMDFNESTAADRVGHRIKEIREAQGMTQAELGELVGLNGDRVQKYENGVRKPKAELLKRFAGALGVSTLALTDPIVANYFGVSIFSKNYNNKFEIIYSNWKMKDPFYVDEKLFLDLRSIIFFLFLLLL